MKRIVAVIAGAIACSSFADVAHVAGGLSFNKPVTVDGVDYPANTTIWAESYPTQFVVQIVPSSGNYIFYAESDAAHDTYRVYPRLDGSFLLMPPPAADDVISYDVKEFANVVWADANTAVPDVEQDGSEAKPFRVLQRAIDALDSKSYRMVLVKKGVYDEGGSEKSTSYSASRVNLPGKTAVIVRAVDGPEETFIVGGPDPAATTPGREGWGEDAVRCAMMGSKGCCIQGFTLTGGYAATRDASKGGYKSGAAVYTQTGGATVMDCIISNCYGSIGVAAGNGVALVRCRVLENHNESTVVDGGSAVSCEVRDNELLYDASGNRLFSASPAYNCTLAGNVVGSGRQLSTGDIYNSIIDGSGQSTYATGTNNWVWHFSETSRFPAGFKVANPRFKSTSPYDLHLVDSSPCLDSVPAPTADNWGATYYRHAAGDVEGNRLRIAADGKLTAGAFQTGVTEGYPGYLYVDPVNGDDANDGWRTNRAMRTLAAALTNAYTESGSVVYAMPGVYDTGVMTTNLNERTLSRVIVPDGVSLVSTGGREETFIVGEPAPLEKRDLVHDDMGCASNAVRCVLLGDNSLLAGFTLTNGYACALYSNNNWSSGDNGGGVAYSIGSCVSNCDIVCCKAYLGAGLGYGRTTGVSQSNGTFLNCRFLDNRALAGRGQAAYGGGQFVNCLFDRCFYGEAAYDSGAAVSTVINCTFGPDCQFSVRDPKEGRGIDLYNTIVMSKPKMGSNYHRCLFVVGLEPPNTAVTNNCICATAAEIGYLQGSRRHRIGDLKSTSVAIGKATAAYYTAGLPGIDVYGRERVNGDLDLGCTEYWQPTDLPGMQLIFR